MGVSKDFLESTSKTWAIEAKKKKKNQQLELNQAKWLLYCQREAAASRTGESIQLNMWESYLQATMSISTQLTPTKNWKQPRCLPIDDLNNENMAYIHTTDYCSGTERQNEILSSATKWTQSEAMMLSQTSWSQEDKYVFPNLW